MKFKQNIKKLFSKSEESAQKRSVKTSNIIYLVAGFLIIIFINVIGRYIYTRFDLTAEKRYTLADSTKKLLRGIDETILFRIYLEGDFPADFKRLQNETKDLLNQFRSYNNYVEYEFVNPNDFTDKEEQMVFYQKLASKGIQPTTIQVKKDNAVTQQVVIPAADVIYRGREVSVNLLPSQKYKSPDEQLNDAVQSLEYAFTDAIRKLENFNNRRRVGFLQGHGELERNDIYDIQMTLVDYYRLENVTINGNINALTERRIDPKDSSKYILTNKFDVLVVPKPTQAFSDQDLYILDQFVMYGGKILWLIDPVAMDIDSLQNSEASIALRFPFENLDEMLFSYGVRINPNLVMDIRCMPIPMQDGVVGDRPTINYHPWFYFPEFVPNSTHPIVKNLDLIKGEFVSSIDLIDNDIEKTVLLTTSEYTHLSTAPARVELNVARVEPDERLFTQSNLPVAVLLEGSFKSAWRNRLSPNFTEIPEMGYRETSDTTKMIVIADGDMIRNRFNYKNNFAYPLGYDNWTGTMYANKSFILNAINYLCGDEDILELRSRDITLRKLNQMAIRDHRLKYQLINSIVPIIIVIVAGIAIIFIRKKRNIKKDPTKK